MAAAIPALMGVEIISNLFSGLFQHGNQQGNQFGNQFGNQLGGPDNAYTRGLRDGVFLDEMSHRRQHDGETNITINNFNPRDRILF
jgi:hypothetical protein